MLQVDSVNVLQRAHYMPLYSRMGAVRRRPARPGPAASARCPRRMVEYWAHVQALMPVDLWPVMQHRMADYRGPARQVGLRRGGARAGGRLLAEVRDRGRLDRPRPRRRPAPQPRSTGAGTGRRPARSSTTSTWPATWPSRAATSQFEVLYDLPERVIPADGPPPRPPRRPPRRTASWCAGPRARTASPPLRCLRDYYRMHVKRRAAARSRSWSRTASCSRPRSPAGGDRRTCTATPGCRAGSTPGRCSAPSTRWCGSASAPSGSSTSATASRSTCPPTSACTATTCCRSCSGDRIVARVDLKADRRDRAPAGQGGLRRAGGAAGHRRAARGRAGSSSPAGSGLAEVTVEPRGDLAPRALLALGSARCAG